MSASPSRAISFNPRYTLADYQQWAGDWELWNGVAVAMGPSPFGPHGALFVELAVAFRLALRAVRDGDHVVVGEIDWIVNDHTVVRPDLCILRGPVPQRHIVSPPVLITEVLSDSTADKDRTEKYALYQQQGVQYYLIADPSTNQIDINVLHQGCYHLEPPASHHAFTLSGTCSIDVDFRW